MFAQLAVHLRNCLLMVWFSGAAPRKTEGCLAILAAEFCRFFGPFPKMQLFTCFTFVYLLLVFCLTLLYLSNKAKLSPALPHLNHTTVTHEMIQWWGFFHSFIPGFILSLSSLLWNNGTQSQAGERQTSSWSWEDSETVQVLYLQNQLTSTCQRWQT